MTWYNPVSWFVAPSAAPAPPAVKRGQLEQALAYVDPSKLVFGWKVTPYNPGWLATRRGLAVFDAMKRDEQVKFALKFKKDAVLAAGWEVVSPGDQDENWEVTRFVRDALTLHLHGGWHAAQVALLTALEYGFACLERVYEEQEDGEWTGKQVLRRLTPLKPHYIDFDVDAYGTLLGVIQQVTHTIGDPMPPGKFLIYSHTQEFCNCYGISDLEACYRPWWVKDSAYKWLAVVLERYGMPPLFALYNPNAYGGGRVEELKKVIKGIQNATLGVLPRNEPGDLEMWSQELGRGSSDIFLKAIDRFDQHIARGLLVPSMVGVASEQNQDGSLARSKQHFESFMQVVLQLQADLAGGVVNAQMIPQLCDLNFPGLQSYPLFRYLPFTDEKRLEVMTAWGALVGAKIVNRLPDDEVHIRKVLGFPENEDPQVQEEEAPPQPGAAPAKPPVPPKAVPHAEQSVEMRAFAEQADGVWVEAGGATLCVPAAEWEEAYATWDEAEHPREPAGSGSGGQFVGGSDGQQRDERIKPSLAGLEGGPYKIIGVELFSPEERLQIARNQILRLEERRKALVTISAKGVNTGTQWELKNSRALKRRELADIKARLQAWDAVAQRKFVFDPDQPRESDVLVAHEGKAPGSFQR